VPVVIGGSGKAALRRAVTWGDGITIGGGPPVAAAGIVQAVRAAWAEAGREGEPRILKLNYYSLGSEAHDDSRGYLRHYYAILGDYVDSIAEGALRTEDAIREAAKKFADAGITELYLDPTTPELDQVDRLADVLL
jgi:alkanesulfonate monooxygenase SsuD/methylene tetrahydromethanopterin reductase-like flavin-dependent oxidoreductase (luciferase family)